MVEIVLDVMVQKSPISFGIDGGGKAEKVAIIGVLENKPMTIADKEGINTLSMEVLMVVIICYGVAGPSRS